MDILTISEIIMFVVYLVIFGIPFFLFCWLIVSLIRKINRS